VRPVGRAGDIEYTKVPLPVTVGITIWKFSKALRFCEAFESDIVRGILANVVPETDAVPFTAPTFEVVTVIETVVFGDKPETVNNPFEFILAEPPGALEVLIFAFQVKEESKLDTWTV
jgi:hypothetical protein